MNRFKELTLVNSVLEELWTEVHNIVQEAMNKTILKQKKRTHAKWLSEEALKIVEEKGELNAREKGKKVHPTKCRVQKNSKEGQEGLLQ